MTDHSRSVSKSDGRYLALGDSYTIGEGVDPNSRWPVQLAQLLRGRGIAIADPEIVAHTGWTCEELGSAIDAAPPSGPFALVSLLIGVNDQYRGGSSTEYAPRFTRLLDLARTFADGEPRRVLVLSLPDWGVSPFAAGRDRAAIATAIDAFNAANRDATMGAGATYVDVTTASRRADGASDYAADGLHPSARAYAEWADRAADAAAGALGS